MLESRMLEKRTFKNMISRDKRAFRDSIVSRDRLFENRRGAKSKGLVDLEVETDTYHGPPPTNPL